MEEMLPLFEIRVGSKDSKALGIYRPSVDTRDENRNRKSRLPGLVFEVLPMFQRKRKR